MPRAFADSSFNMVDTYMKTSAINVLCLSAESGAGAAKETYNFLIKWQTMGEKSI